MAIKRILVTMTAEADPHPEIECGLTLARALAAHVEVLYLHERRRVPAGVAAPGSMQLEMAGGRPLGIPAGAQAELVRQQEVHASRADAALQSLKSTCRLHGVAMREEGAAAAAPPSAGWREIMGDDQGAAAHAIAYDLTIASSAAIAEALSRIADTALLDARRPVLLAPRRHERGLEGLAVVAWDGSAPCWHALSAALPLLHHFEEVELLSIDGDEGRWQAQHDDVLDYLRCHGIAGRARVTPSLSRPTGDALLAEAADAGAGLLVMGAYGHSRLRERLFGGATRHVLANALQTPVLMAH